MKKIAALAFILSTVVVTTIVAINSASADGYDRQSKRRAASYDYSMRPIICSGGWWQTLYYGHVKPHWRTRCVR